MTSCKHATVGGRVERKGDDVKPLNPWVTCKVHTVITKTVRLHCKNDTQQTVDHSCLAWGAHVMTVIETCKCNGTPMSAVCGGCSAFFSR